MSLLSPTLPLDETLRTHILLAWSYSKQVALLKRLGMTKTARDSKNMRHFHICEARSICEWARSEGIALAPLTLRGKSAPAPAAALTSSLPITFPAMSLDGPQVAELLNAVMGCPTPEPSTKENGYFAGYGCRWDRCSGAWFVVMPYDLRLLAERIEAAFKTMNCKDVSISNEGGLDQAAGGRGIQVSAYV